MVLDDKSYSYSLSTEIPFMMSDFIRDFKKFTANAVIKDIQNMPESRRDWML